MSAPVRVLAIPGGGSSASAYYPDLRELLAGRARLLELDAPGYDAERRWLKPAHHAGFLADAISRDDEGPVLVVGHSLGALVALRLVLDRRELVAGLVLLDPSPPIFGLLLPRPLLRLVGTLRRPFRRRGARPVPSPRALRLRTRIRWYFGATFLLAADLAVTDLAHIPAIVVSAAEHRPESVFRRTHARLVRAIPGAQHEVWPDTTHGLATEQPNEVANRVLELLDRVG